MIMLLSLTIPVGTVSAAGDFHTDWYEPEVDVSQVTESGGLTKVTGHPNIDIVQMSSWKDDKTVLAGDEVLVFNVTVKGNVLTSDSVQYAVVIITSGDDYIFAYKNGAVTGVNLNTGKWVTVGVTGAASGSTLKISILYTSLGSPSASGFDWMAATAETVSDTEKYADIAPDKIALIKTPYEGAATFGDVDIRGVTRKSVYAITSVEAKVGASSTYQPITLNPDGSWNFTWNSTAAAASNGAHTVYVKAMDSQGNEFTDSMVFYINQNYDIEANRPSLDAIASPRVGDWAEYDIVGSSTLSLSSAVTTELTTEVVAAETIEVNGNSYETYRSFTHQEGALSVAGFSVEQTVDRTSWRTRSDQSLVQEVTFTNTSGEGFNTEERETVSESTYQPPLETNDLPIVVMEGWSGTSTVESHVETTTDGDTQTSDKTETQNVDLYCLRTDTITFKGTQYTAFLVRQEIEDTGVYTVNWLTADFHVPLKVDTYDSNRAEVASLILSEFIQGPGYYIDLTGELTVSPDELEVNTEITVTATLENLGDVDATGIEVKMSDGTNQLATTTVDVPALSTSTATLTWTPTKHGNYTLNVTAGKDYATIKVYVPPSPEPPGPPLWLYVLIACIGIGIIAVLVLKRRSSSKQLEQEIDEKQAAAGEEKPEELKKEDFVAEEEPPAAAPAVDMAESTEEAVECPKCGKTSYIEVKVKPMKMGCPYCSHKFVHK